MPFSCVVLCENTLPLIQVDWVVFGATWNMPGRHGVSQVFPVPPVPGGLAGISLSEPLMRLLLRLLVYSWFCDPEIGLVPVPSCGRWGALLAGAVLMRRALRLCEGCGFLADGSNLKALSHSEIRLGLGVRALGLWQSPRWGGGVSRSGRPSRPWKFVGPGDGWTPWLPAGEGRARFMRGTRRSCGGWAWRGASEFAL